MTSHNLGKENEEVEFKKSTGELKEGVISIAAMLNKHGRGTLYFGVKNNGDIIGQQITDSTLRDVSRAVTNHITPTVYPTIEEKKIGEQSFIQVQFEGSQRPYLAYNIPRIRVADEDLVMEQPLYEEMLRKRDNITHAWESQVSKYTFDDIDANAFEAYLEKARKANRIVLQEKDPRSILTKLGLAADDGIHLLNAGAAVFVNSGINELQMAKFVSDRRLKFTDIQRETGSVLRLIDLAVNYVSQAIDWRVEFNGQPERDEVPEIPLDAVREAVVNAFAHRRIESGQSVEVAVYRSYIDIYSPGTFPENVTPEMFILENRKPIRRNPLITRTLYYSKDMESFATGLKRIQDLCDKAGCKTAFFNDGYGFTVRFYRHSGKGWNMGSPLEDALHNNFHGPIPPVSPPREPNTLHKDILNRMKENPTISQLKLAEDTGTTRRVIQRAVEALVREGRVKRIGGTRGYWKVKQ